MDDHRRLLKSDRWHEWASMQTDQKQRVPRPPLEKPCPEGAELTDLTAPGDFQVGRMPLVEAIARRQSRRRFTPDPLTLEELSFLLWSTQGVHESFGSGQALRRTVPSGGGRHPFETYLAVQRVEGLDPGLYRYLSVEHKLCLLRQDDQLMEQIGEACAGQGFAGSAAVTFVWTAIPYRTEWRYSTLSPKIIALDAGHVCQNLYLAAEAIGAGACAIAAYYQEDMDRLLGVDGEEEFAVYAAPVGKIEGD